MKSAAVFLIAFFFISCARTYTVPGNIVKEKITHQRLSQAGMQFGLVNLLILPLGVLSAQVPEGGNSGLKWLPVLDKKGDTLEVEITSASTFMIKTKSNETVKMLAMSAFIENGFLKGKRSQILGMSREISIDSISEIEVYTENSKVRDYRRE